MDICMGTMSSSAPLLDEKPSSTSIVLQTDPAKHKGERGCEKNRSKIIVNGDIILFPIF
jgi:hypothetical protein